MKYDKIKDIKKVIENSEAILITAGAGMGVDSGLPDFRGNKGLWKAYPPIKELGLSFSDMANPIWFEDNPELAWAFYGHRLNLYRDTIPHDGFKMLLDLVKEKKDNYFIFTSNVDGQFQKAGFNKNKIYEVHGSIHYLQCSNDCLSNSRINVLNKNIEKYQKDGIVTGTPSFSLDCFSQIWKNEENIEVNMEKFESLNIPLCPQCGEVARPNILMFGDWSWNAKRAISQEHKYNTWRIRNFTKRIAIIEIGAGLTIPTVRLEGENIVKYHKNATLIRINSEDFEINKNIGISIALTGLEGIKSIL